MAPAFARRATRAAGLVRMAGPGPYLRAARRARNEPAPGRAARDAVYRRLWSEAAQLAGAEHADLGRGFSELQRDGRRVRVFHQVTPLDDPVTLRLALDKTLAHERLTAARVAVPEHAAFTAGDPGPALALLERAEAIVVKPAAGTAGGEGVTAQVRSAEDLAQATRAARRFGDRLLAERQAPGPLHRLLLLDGELLDVVVNHPPHVEGDGSATVEALVVAENHRRRVSAGEAGLELLELDADLLFALRGQGLRLGSVPAAGRAVAVKTVTNDCRLEDSETYRATVHPDVLEQARAGAAALGVRLAGVDVVAPAIDRPLAETGGAVLEVNATPGLHRHAHVRDRASATRVAVPVLERMLAEAEAPA